MKGIRDTSSRLTDSIRTTEARRYKGIRFVEDGYRRGITDTGNRISGGMRFTSLSDRIEEAQEARNLQHDDEDYSVSRSFFKQMNEI